MVYTGHAHASTLIKGEWIKGHRQRPLLNYQRIGYIGLEDAGSGPVSCTSSSLSSFFTMRSSLPCLSLLFMKGVQHLTFSQLFMWKEISSHPIPTGTLLPTVVSMDTGLMVQVSRKWLL